MLSAPYAPLAGTGLPYMYCNSFEVTASSVPKLSTEEAGLPPVAHGVIERGPVELVEHFSTISTNKAIDESVLFFESYDEFLLLNRIILQ